MQQRNQFFFLILKKTPNHWLECQPEIKTWICLFCKENITKMDWKSCSSFNISHAIIYCKEKSYWILLPLITIHSLHMARRCATVHMGILNMDWLGTRHCYGELIACYAKVIVMESNCSGFTALRSGVCLLVLRLDILSPQTSKASSACNGLLPIIVWSRVLGEVVMTYKLVCSICFSILGFSKHENNQILAAFTFDIHLE